MVYVVKFNTEKPMYNIANLIKSSMESEEPFESEELTEDSVLDAVESEAEYLESEQDVVTHSEAVDRLEQAEEALESLYQQLQYDIEHNGGVSQEAYPYAFIAYRNTMKSIGAQTLLPSHESFQGNVALESVGENLKKVWETLVNFMKSVIEHIKNFFKTIFDKVERVKRGLNKLKERLKEAKFDAVDEVSISKKESIMLDTPKQGNDLSKLADTMKTTAGEVFNMEKLLNQQFDIMEKMRADLEATGKDPSNLSVDVKRQMTTEIYDRVAKLTNSATKFTFTETSERMKVKTSKSGAFSIGAYVILREIKETTLFGKPLSFVRFKKEVYEVEGSEPSDKIAQISKSDIEGFINKSLEIITMIEKERIVRKEMDVRKDKFLNTVMVKYKELKDKPLRDADKTFFEAAKFYRECFNNDGKLSSISISALVNVIGVGIGVSARAVKKGSK